MEQTQATTAEQIIAWIDKAVSNDAERKACGFTMLVDIDPKLLMFRKKLAEGESSMPEKQLIEEFAPHFHEYCRAITQSYRRAQATDSVIDAVGMITEVLFILDSGYEMINDYFARHCSKEEVLKHKKLYLDFTAASQIVNNKRNAVFNYSDAYKNVELFSSKT